MEPKAVVEQQRVEGRVDKVPGRVMLDSATQCEEEFFREAGDSAKLMACHRDDAASVCMCMDRDCSSCGGSYVHDRV